MEKVVLGKIEGLKLEPGKKEAFREMKFRYGIYSN